MNKALAAAVLTASVFLGVAASAKEARIVNDRGTYGGIDRKWTPISLNIATPAGLPACFGWDYDVYGLELGIYNRVDYFKGLQFGGFNSADRFNGLQLGLINYARQAYGMQIGFVNVIGDCDMPFLPVVNWNF